jgi:WD40 repeat protein
VSLYDVGSAGRGRRQLRGDSAEVKAVSFHPDGSRLVSCSGDGQLKIWDWRSGEVLLTLSVPGGGILWHVVFSPDGGTIAGAGGDGLVSLWSIE